MRILLLLPTATAFLARDEQNHNWHSASYEDRHLPISEQFTDRSVEDISESPRCVNPKTGSTRFLVV